MSKVWANPVWFFFHGMAEKVHEDFYRKNCKACLDIIKKICTILPCPMCRSAAVKYMRKIHYSHVLTKRQFQEMLYNFHNYVNKKLRKRIFLKKELKIYKRLNFIRTTRVMCSQLKNFNRGMFRIVSSQNSDIYITYVETSILKYKNFFI